MLPCVKSVFSPVKRNPPLAHHAVERADGADHAVRVLFGDAVQQRAERLKELRVVLLRQLPPGVRQGDAGHASVLGCGIGWVCGFTGSGGGILMLTVFTLVLGYNLKVAVGTSTMIMTLVALTGAVSHISLGARIFPLPMAVVVLSCLLGAVVSAKFANRCEIARLNRIVGIALVLLGIVTIAVKLL